jgi:hypothetical protein
MALVPETHEQEPPLARISASDRATHPRRLHRPDRRTQSVVSAVWRRAKNLLPMRESWSCGQRRVLAHESDFAQLHPEGVWNAGIEPPLCVAHFGGTAHPGYHRNHIYMCASDRLSAFEACAGPARGILAPSTCEIVLARSPSERDAMSATRDPFLATRHKRVGSQLLRAIYESA